MIQVHPRAGSGGAGGCFQADARAERLRLRAPQKLDQGVFDKGGQGPAMTRREFLRPLQQVTIKINRRTHT